MEKTWSTVESLSWEDALTLISDTKDVYDDLWKQTDYEPAYPQERMEHLLQVDGRLLFMMVMIMMMLLLLLLLLLLLFLLLLLLLLLFLWKCCLLLSEDQRWVSMG